MKQLFTAQATNADSAEITWPGGAGILAAEGTWDSGTIKVQISPDGGTTFVDLTDISITADGTKTFIAPPGQLKLNLAGATTPALDAWVSGTEVD